MTFLRDRRLAVAGLAAGKNGARGTTHIRGNYNRAGGETIALTHFCVTVSIFSPFTYFTVNWAANFSVAGFFFIQDRSIANKGFCHRTAPEQALTPKTCTTPTGSGTFTPRRPVRVPGLAATFARAANGNFKKARARTLIGAARRLHDFASASVLAHTTSDGARAPLTPLTHLALLGAFKFIADLGLLEEPNFT